LKHLDITYKVDRKNFSLCAPRGQNGAHHRSRHTITRLNVNNRQAYLPNAELSASGPHKLRHARISTSSYPVPVYCDMSRCERPKTSLCFSSSHIRTETGQEIKPSTYICCVVAGSGKH